MKKLLAILCTVVLLSATLSIPAYAVSPSLAADADNYSAKAGDTIQIKIRLKNNPGLYALCFEMPIDPKVFEFVGKDYNNSIFGQDNFSDYDSTTNSFKLNNRVSDSN